MNKKEISRIFLQPGYIFIPNEETLIQAVTGSGILIAIYDHQNCFGGMSYFIKSKINKKKSTPHYALPSIKSLLKLFMNRGSKTNHLEASIIGGAENKKHKSYEKDLHKTNADAATRILNKLNINIINTDTGGYRGRKIVFNSKSGEMIVAKVNTIRETDWYPKVI